MEDDRALSTVTAHRVIHLWKMTVLSTVTAHHVIQSN